MEGQSEEYSKEDLEEIFTNAGSGRNSDTSRFI